MCFRRSFGEASPFVFNECAIDPDREHKYMNILSRLICNQVLPKHIDPITTRLIQSVMTAHGKLNHKVSLP